ncbi:hypothetical protein GA0070624_3884 [Micromonospora rhizosphaerae]|uniref:Uncharacterized protein n=1 Tax=Micromonospora rhizosphaerae TaxID=568872 RepID=A0A1C6SJ79_9ACTN|nr:hypothetical protein [Micromonospora rhizosphaerae]SCL29447.1 hypothetical protein GA0070624_3884 [Micromonospora rhizosphaerae]
MSTLTQGLTRPGFIGWLTGERTRIWLQRKAVGLWMNVIILLAVAVAALTAGGWPAPQAWGVAALKLFVLWCLSFLPGWLYVRFLGMRAKVLWHEYVLNLHRLGWDSHRRLPALRPDSDAVPGGPDGRALRTDNIYRQKFESYYGRQVPRAALRDAPDEDRDDYLVSSESLFPVFLATAMFAAGWAAVLWDTRFVVAPAGVWDVLKYAFLGAYAFVTGMLLRRYFQTDLRPSAYASAVLRVILVLLVVTVVHQVVGATAAVAQSAEMAVAFVIGFFPLVGLQFLERLTSRVLRFAVPTVAPDYPLDQLDGLNLWYEARLVEEGVEDMQNLTTMNLVDVILHTRVPTGRLVDWVDQAFLLIHLEQAERREVRRERRKDGCGTAHGGAAARVRLRRAGIRTATDLLKVFSTEDGEDPGTGLPRRRYRAPDGVGRLPLPEDQLRLLVAVLAAEPGLAPVWNWQRNGVPLDRDAP